MMETRKLGSQAVPWVLALLVAVHMCPAGFAQTGRNETIVQTGDLSPDGNGVFNYFFSPLLNNEGALAVAGQLAGTAGGVNDDEGTFRFRQGTVTQILREGDQVPDGNGTYGLVGPSSMNSKGDMTLWGWINGSGVVDDQGIFLEAGGAVSHLIRKGQFAPDGNGTYLAFRDVMSNETGTTAFFGWLEGTSGGTFVDDSGIFVSSGAQIHHVARAAQAAPDGNGVFGANNVVFDDPTLNNNGDVAFLGFLTGTSGGWGVDDRGVFLGNGGTLTQVARAGWTAPDGNGIFQSFAGPSLSDAGSVAFAASLTGTVGGATDDDGIFLESGGAITQIARAGQIAPGGGRFDYFGGTMLTDSETVTFGAVLSGGQPAIGYFRYDGGVTSEIVRTGNSTPDGSATFANFTRFATNKETGTAAFSGVLQDQGGGFNGHGVFLGDGRDLIEVARTGQIIDGSAIADLQFQHLGGGPNATALNRAGQLAYLAITSDGRHFIRQFTPDLHWREQLGGSWDVGSNWTLGVNPAEPHSVFVSPSASTTILGPSKDTTVSGLQLGGGSGIATLHLQSGAVLTALQGVSIESTGQLTGDGGVAGDINNFGTVVADNITVTSTLQNFSLIRGTGRIDANIVNDIVGKIRVASGDQMSLSGPSLANAGLVEVNNGELEVAAPIWNQPSTGLISIRNGSLIANTGIANDGSIAMTFGNSTIQGDIDNLGTIQVSGGAHATFFDDVVQEGTMQIATIGNTNSVAVVLGEFSGSGGFVGGGDLFALGDLRPGSSPASVLMDGNLFLGAATDTLIELGGLGLGEFDQMIVTGDLSLAGNLQVDLINGHALTFNDEYLIADVGAELFGEFGGLTEGDLVGNYGGMDLFISYAAGSGNDVALYTAVAEPGYSVVGLALTAALVWVRRRRRKVA